MAFESAVAFLILGVTYIFLDVSFRLDEKVHPWLKYLFFGAGMVMVLQTIGTASYMSEFNYTSNLTRVSQALQNYLIIGSFVAVLCIFYFAFHVFLKPIIDLNNVKFKLDQENKRKGGGSY